MIGRGKSLLPLAFSKTLLRTLSSTSSHGQTSTLISSDLKGSSQTASGPHGGPDFNYINRAGLVPDRMPKHVMVILDGNRRWCEKNGKDLTYEPFYNRYIMLADICIKLGIPMATWSVFATCTWKRSLEATDLIFRQFQASLEDSLENFTRQGIKVSVLGEKQRLPTSLQSTIETVEKATENGETLHMMYHMSYGGRWDMVEAARSISQKAMSREIEPEYIDEAMVQQHLSTSKVMMDNNGSHPDLMIRCAGKQRFSNFYLWQLAYTELDFSDLLYFDFGEAEFLDALRWFQLRGRRFGK